MSFYWSIQRKGAHILVFLVGTTAMPNCNLIVAAQNPPSMKWSTCAFLHGFLNRNLLYPRLVALAVIQGVMSLGLSYYALGLVGQVYIVAISMGFGYGAHWSIALAAASELFGLKNFGTLYNFLTMASPSGSLLLSALASTIYDYYAEQQAEQHRMQNYLASAKLAMPYYNNTGNNELLLCEGNICYSLTCVILAVVCLFAAALSLIIVHRTKRFYAQLYVKSGSWDGEKKQGKTCNSLGGV